MNMTVEIRYAQEKDLLRMSKLWLDLAEMHEDLMEDYDLTENAQDEWINLMEEAMANNHVISFLAEEEGKLLGFISVSLRKRAPIFRLKNVGAIMDVVVEEGSRGKGVGTSLVLRTESWIRERGFELAVLTVAPENTGAMKFWDRLGYNTYLHKKVKKL